MSIVENTVIVVNSVAKKPQEILPASAEGNCVNKIRAEGTVGKAMEVLEAVASFGRPARFSEILADVPYPKATLHRLLYTLRDHGMLSHDPERSTYGMGMRLVRLAHAAWAQASIAPLARPHVDQLSSRLGETVHLAQLDAGHVLYVDKRNAHNPIEMFSEAGKIGPAYCTGIGKAMLAFLPPGELENVLPEQSFQRHTPATITDGEALRRELKGIRKTGISYDREEHEPRIICVAVPILNEAGTPLGALSVTSSTLRHSLDELSRYAPELQATARSISTNLQPWAFPEPRAAQQKEHRP